jgi:hypothetical protein
MKRITITVPDHVLRTLSTFTTSKTSHVETTPENFIKALECTEYDEHYYYPPGSVTVESIVDIDGPDTEKDY